MSSLTLACIICSTLAIAVSLATGDKTGIEIAKVSALLAIAAAIVHKK
jgi:hypothetical protein